MNLPVSDGSMRAEEVETRKLIIKCKPWLGKNIEQPEKVGFGLESVVHLLSVSVSVFFF